MEILIAIISGGVGSGIMAIVLACLNRKWAKEDKSNDRLEAIVYAQKVLMIDRVRYLGKAYINSGEITLDDKENISDMHKAYKALGGNGHLDQVMDEINKLKVVG